MVDQTINLYQQQEYLSFSIKDIKPSDFDSETAMLELQLYEQYYKEHYTPQLVGYYPTREDFAVIYRYLRQHVRSVYTIDSLLAAMHSPSIGAFKLLMVLDIMKEMKLIVYSRTGDLLNVQLQAVSGKVDLDTSLTYRKLKEVISHVGHHS